MFSAFRTAIHGLHQSRGAEGQNQHVQEPVIQAASAVPYQGNAPGAQQASVMIMVINAF